MPKITIEHVQIHRFHNLTALHTNGNKTTYFSPVQAREVIKAMQACVDDIEENNFQHSEFKTTELNY